MGDFVVSALKYRPQSFDDVAGQNSVTKTLENALKQNQIPQALLFCGPRGVGKTTCARIFAKKINSNYLKGDSSEFSYNIFELDAASNNGVDDIRNLIDQVRIPPQVGKYKIYIIDEVHMLSGQAFNAFLKTLEEPPSYAIFILATTEKHKVIPTILSRCQIYDFKKISINDIVKFLRKIAEKEQISFDEESLFLIGKKSDGALRDALTIFDRLVNYTEGKITKELTYENLNLLDNEIYFETFENINKKNIHACLITLNTIIQNGFSEKDFIDGFASHLRDLLVSKNQTTRVLLEQNEEVKDKYIKQSQLKDSKFIIDAIDLSEECSYKYKGSKNQRLLIEICLMKLCLLGEDEKKKILIDPEQSFKNKPNPNKGYNNSDHTITVKKDLKQTTKASNNEIILDENKLISGLSLSSLKIKKSIEKQKRETENKEKLDIKSEKFSSENLVKYWKEFYHYLEKNGEKNLASILQIDKPIKVGENEIHYTLPNNTNKSELEKNKKELINFLKKKLNNRLINLKVHVNKEVEKKFIYSTKEKFEKLKEINPEIEKIRKEFKLGF